MTWDTGLHWRVLLVGEPDEEPLELAYVRDKHLRVNNGAVEDVLIEELIKTAREMCERFTRRAVPPQTLQLLTNGFPRRHFELPKPPLIDVLSLEYETSGGTVVMDPAEYTVLTRGLHGVVAPVTSWPTALSQADAVTLTYRAGYGVLDTSVSPSELNAAVPSTLKAGMALVVGELYKNRSLSVAGFGVGVSPTVLSAEYLWTPYRVDLAVA